MKRLLVTLLTAMGLLTRQLEAAPLSGFQLVAQTENFAFYARPGNKVDAERCQHFFAKTAQLLSQDMAGRQSAYYVHKFPEEIAFATGMYSTGAALSTGDIHSTRSFHPHEIVHRVAFELGDPGTFFREGLAVALGDEGRWNGTAVDKLARASARRWSFRTVADRFEALESDASYPLAGSFVGHLIRSHGVAKVAAFFRACGSKPETRDLRFQEVFGQSLDDAAKAWTDGLAA